MNIKLYNLLISNARAGRDAPAIRAEAATDANHIYLYDVIDSYWGVSASGLVQALTDAGTDKPVHMHVNSPGGDVFEARAMVSAVRAHQARGGSVVAFIDGLAASAATYVALAANQVHMAEGGMFMVHNSWTLSYGNKTDLRATADLLEKIDGTIAADYRRKTAASAAQVAEWMDAETWFTAEEALAAGFVDGVMQPPATEGAKANRWNLAAYANAPKAAAPAAPAPPAAAASPASTPAAQDAAHQRRQQQLNNSRLHERQLQT